MSKAKNKTSISHPNYRHILRGTKLKFLSLRGAPLKHLGHLQSQRIMYAFTWSPRKTLTDNFPKHTLLPLQRWYIDPTNSRLLRSSPTDEQLWWHYIMPSGKEHRHLGTDGVGVWTIFGLRNIGEVHMVYTPSLLLMPRSHVDEAAGSKCNYCSSYYGAGLTWEEFSPISTSD